MIAIVTGVVTVLAGVVAPAPVRCDYAQRIECSAAGCQPTAVSGRFLRLPTASALVAATAAARDASQLPAIDVCDAKGCTPIMVRAVQGGAFLNVAQDGGAHFVKVALRDLPPGIRAGDFVEVGAQFLSTVTHVGSCPAVTR
jgi:hypothetical protein